MAKFRFAILAKLTDRFRFIFSTLILLAGIAGAAVGCAPSGGSEDGAGGALPSTEALAEGSYPLSVGVHYVAFRNPDTGGTVASETSVQQMLGKMSAVWDQCKVSFHLQRYETVDPEVIDASFAPANYSELDQIRIKLQEASSLLMVGTGTWNRAGDLGNSGSNCYSSFPGDEAEGIVCEASEATGTMINAHESGHYFNLIHTDNPAIDGVDDTGFGNVGGNLMNHVVAPANDDLTRGQCVRARTAIGDHRRGTLG